MAFLSAKPAWSEPMTIFMAGMGGSLSEKLLSGSDNIFGSEAELFQDVFQGRGGAEGAHADGCAFGADVTFPAESGGHFDGNARGDGRRQDAFFVGSVLAVEKLPRGHADHARLDAVSGKLFLRGNAKRKFRACADENDFGFSGGSIGENVSAFGDAGSRSEFGAVERRHGLARQ